MCNRETPAEAEALFRTVNDSGRNFALPHERQRLEDARRRWRLAVTNEQKVATALTALNEIQGLCVQPWVPGEARVRLSTIQGIVAQLIVTLETPSYGGEEKPLTRG